MKKFLLLAFPLVFPACSMIDSISGSGHIISENREVKNFSGIDLSGSGKVIYTPDSIYSVRVECDDNVIRNVETNVSGNTLSIGLKRGSYSNISLTVYVSAPMVSNYSVSGSGEISSKKNISADNVSAEISGSGEISLSGQSNSLGIDISGSGEFHGFDLQTQNCSSEISGSGDAEVNVAKSLKAEISGSGTVTYIGQPSVDADVSGSGKVRRR